jgi:hypothetical protein
MAMAMLKDMARKPLLVMTTYYKHQFIKAYKKGKKAKNNTNNI